MLTTILISVYILGIITTTFVGSCIEECYPEISQESSYSILFCPSFYGMWPIIPVGILLILFFTIFLKFMVFVENNGKKFGKYIKNKL